MKFGMRDLARDGIGVWCCGMVCVCVCGVVVVV